MHKRRAVNLPASSARVNDRGSERKEREPLEEDHEAFKLDVKITQPETGRKREKAKGKGRKKQSGRLCSWNCLILMGIERYWHPRVDADGDKPDDI